MSNPCPHCGVDVNDLTAEIDRLLDIESRLDLAIAMLPTFDGNGPGDCTDRLVAAVRKAAKQLSIVILAGAVRTPPYPWCHQPAVCIEKGYCPEDPNCGE